MSATVTSTGSERDALRPEHREIVSLLEHACWMELHTDVSCVANSVNPDGVRARAVSDALAEDIEEELAHARRFAERIKELDGLVPGSQAFVPSQAFLQPPEEQTDIAHVIKGVIEAERQAIEHYERVIELTDRVDPVTQDLVIGVLRDEQGHKRMFVGFLREYESAEWAQ